MSESKPSSSGISNIFNSAVGKLNHSIQQVPSPNTIQHSLRQQAVLHNPHQAPETLSIQLLNKAILSQTSDFTSLARETKLVARTLQEWGKDEKGEGLSELSNTIASLITIQAEVEKQLCLKLEESRAELKLIRNLGNELVAYRQKKELLIKQGSSTKTSFTSRDHELERMDTSTFDIYKREKLLRAFNLQFSAQKELGQKLAIISGFGETLCEKGIISGHNETTSNILDQVRLELKNWTPDTGNAQVGIPSVSVSSNQFDTSTTESEIDAKNLKTISSAEAPNSHSSASTPPHNQSIPSPPTRRSSLPDSSQFPSQGVTSLNLSPPTSLLPTSISHPDTNNNNATRFSPISHTLPLPTELGVPPLTLAETGVPIISGSGGPAKGDLSTPSRPKIPETPISLASLGSGVPDRGSSLIIGEGSTGMVGSDRRLVSRGPDELPQYDEAVVQGGDEMRARQEAESILARERDNKQGHL